MNTVEFDQLLTFWHLKGKITRDHDTLGVKAENGQLQRLRRIQIKSKDKVAKIVYGELFDDDKNVTGYEIRYADIEHNGISKLYVSAEVLTAIQDL